MRILSPSSGRRWLAFVHDVVVAAAAFALALWLRLGDDIHLLPEGTFVWSISLFALTGAVVFLASGLYRGVWAFASVSDLLRIFYATLISASAFTVAGFLLARLEGVPRTAPVIAWFILMAGLGGSRMAFRVLRERRLSALWDRAGGGRVNAIILGAGDEADLFIRAVASNPQSPLRIVGVVGENAKRVGRSIHGVDVLGSASDLPSIVEKLRRRGLPPSRLVLSRSVARADSALTSEIIERCAALGLALSRMPDLSSPRDTIGAASSPQPIAIEDLLGRPETKLDRQAISALINAKPILVTGAGGSIGSELARQIAALAPSRLLLLDSCEYNLYLVNREIRETFPDICVKSILADVRDAKRIGEIFDDERPELVFHAAAIKHVPIAEENPREAILTNVMGTRIVADCAMRAEVAAMVMISTDKAVRPSSVMGATKRLAEMYCQALDKSSRSSRFLTVRFGNVLGSTGSVVPLFRNQLAKGGPITVTHPEVSRWFMTVREAVELVLQASALGTRPDDARGKVLVLDMGQPVKIVDLARQMIRLAGLKPDEDVKISFTGLRAGEKLHEELFAPDEEPVPSAADGVRIAMPEVKDLRKLGAELEGLEATLKEVKDAEAVSRLSYLVPEFAPDAIHALSYSTDEQNAPCRRAILKSS